MKEDWLFNSSQIFWIRNFILNHLSELSAREGGGDSDVRHVATCFRYSRSAMSAVRPGELNIKCDPSSLWPLWYFRAGESALPWPSHHHGPSASSLHQVRQGDQGQEKRRWQNQASGKQQKSNYRSGLNFYKVTYFLQTKRSWGAHLWRLEMKYWQIHFVLYWKLQWQCIVNKSGIFNWNKSRF